MATLFPEMMGAAHASPSNDISTSPTPVSVPNSTQSIPHTTTDVEMKDLDATTGKPAVGAGTQQISTRPIGSTSILSDNNTSPIASSEAATTPIMATDRKENTIPGPSIAAEPLSSTYTAPATTSEAGPSTTNPPAITRQETAAIGPAVDSLPTAATASSGPQLIITLLLTSGARHPYKIDSKYLAKRNVAVSGVTENGSVDPLSISVYTLKELILREWREEWEAKPSSPSSIRLIFFGKLLDDKTALKECKFNSESANVVHMTVRPQDIVDEEDATKNKAMGRERDGGESTAGCRCVIQ